MIKKLSIDRSRSEDARSHMQLHKESIKKSMAEFSYINVGDQAGSSLHTRPKQLTSATRFGQDFVRLRQMPLLFYRKHKQIFQIIIKIILFLMFCAFITLALLKNYQHAKPLLILSIMVFLYIFLRFLHKRGFIEKLTEFYKRVKTPLDKFKTIIRIVIYLVITISFIVFLIINSNSKMHTIISGCGILVFIIISFVFSNDPSRIPWTTVFWGIVLQIILGLIILRWTVGQDLFQYIGDKITHFLGFTDAGSKFVFDENYYLCHEFAFRVMPILIFFNFFVSILYYYNIIQHLILILGSAIQFVLGTTASESTNAAANIFLGMTEAPLLIAPLIGTATKSELHSIMTSGFATIAGTVLAVYRSFGIDANHLLAASILSAPASLVIAKMMYPETYKHVTTPEIETVETIIYRNVIDAACDGAIKGATLIVNIIGGLIATISFLAFVDLIVGWLSSLVGYENIKLEWFGAWIFWPISVVMGINLADAFIVGKLIAIKTFLNEFIAYKQLSDLTASGQFTSERSTVIAIYALCGFSNLSAMGIQIGGLSTLAPGRKGDLSELAFRALISGSMACFMTACVAGLLVDEIPLYQDILTKQTISSENTTS